MTAPMATQILVASGVAMAQSTPAYKSTKRGGGGLLKMLWWQGPTLINPHFATGTKDQDASRLFYEPLASWDAEGNLAGLSDGKIGPLTASAGPITIPPPMPNIPARTPAARPMAIKRITVSAHE